MTELCPAFLLDDHAYAETLGLLLLWELRRAADPKYSQLKPVRGGLGEGGHIRSYQDSRPNADIARRPKSSH
jgi:hypothetical protein